MVKVQLSTLAKQAKRGFERSKRGRDDFIAGTFELATALSKARKSMPSDNAFHQWIAKAGLASVTKDDRSSLIHIGENVKRARAYFNQNPESWSWRSCSTHLRNTIFMTVSQSAKPLTLPNLVVEEREVSLVAPYYRPKPEPEPEPVLKLVATNDDPQPPTPTPTLTELADAERLRTAAAWLRRGVDDDLCSLPASAIAFDCDDISADDVRAVGEWMLMLADALDSQERQKLQTN